MNLDRLTALADQGRKLAGPQHPRRTGHWYRISNQATDRAEVFIYDTIGEFGISADEFVRELRAITAPAIDLHLNSKGGLVFDGVAIYSALRNHSATVDVSIDGIAASAASFIAMAGDRVTIEKPAKMFIHDAHGLALGNASDMRELANLLDQLSDTIAEIYSDRAGGSVSDWRTAMQNETWYSATQAVEAGLADAVAGAENDSAPANRLSQMIRARHRVHIGP